jgi:purine-binding chemotaxis protein CheW
MENESKELKLTRSAKDTDETDRFLVFRLQEEKYAIPLKKVKEVIALAELTTIPEAPSYFKGILNLRGSVISVVDLRVRLKAANVTTGAETSIVIIDIDPYALGVIVDTVDSVISVGESDFHTLREVELHTHHQYLTGVIRKDKELILLLDIDRTLAPEDHQILSKSQPATGSQATQVTQMTA